MRVRLVFRNAMSIIGQMFTVIVAAANA